MANIIKFIKRVKIYYPSQQLGQPPQLGQLFEIELDYIL